jgi:soluble lytic murein transglycosylase
MRSVLAVIALAFVLSVPGVPQQSDAALRAVIEKDKVSRGLDGKLNTLTAMEHLSRGQTYFENRLFPQSREHFQKIFDNFPADPAMSGALFMTGRSFYWERDYLKAITFLDRVAREYPGTKDGREGLSFCGACHVRLGKNAEAAKFYEQYTVMYPTGERIDGAYLNTIDALREAGKYDEAEQWVEKAVLRFAGMATQTNALHARLRMEIYRQKWHDAIATADTLLTLNNFSGAMAGSDEVKFLRAFALEKAGRKAEAQSLLATIPDTGVSYYGALAAEKLAMQSSGYVKPTVSAIARFEKDFPAPYRVEILAEAKKRKLDPRFVLAIMKQESTFRPGIKSPSAARGLLQLTIDTALKYNKKAGFPALQPDDLYVPRTNIAIGCEYIAALRDEFGGLNEAIAASYNGGEDNAARWLNRSKPKTEAIFTAEIGFAETKNYVFKVMTNYRIYRELYDENLNKR